MNSNSTVSESELAYSIAASLGGSVAVYAAAKDKRLKFCAANGAIGRGERRFRFQYRDEAAWQAFRKRLEEAKRIKAETGRSVMLGRFDIVLIPEHNRAGLPPDAVMDFTAETAMSMLDFNPESGRQWLEAGFDFVAVGSDTSLLSAALAGLRKVHRR